MATGPSASANAALHAAALLFPGTGPRGDGSGFASAAASSRTPAPRKALRVLARAVRAPGGGARGTPAPAGRLELAIPP
eukprot:6966253-Lingulodinium_polyedra.AAC.1